MMIRPRFLAIGLLTLAAGCSDSVRPLFVDGVRISADSAHLTIGQSVTLEALALDSRGNPLPERGAFIEWRSTQPGILSLSDSAGSAVTALADALGSSMVETEIGRGSARVPVYVFPAGLVELAIEPIGIRLAVGEALDIQGRLLDSAGASIEPAGFRLSWGFSDDTVALLTGQSTQARLFGRSAGTGRLTFVVNNRRVTVDVMVTN